VVARTATGDLGERPVQPARVAPPRPEFDQIGQYVGDGPKPEAARPALAGAAGGQVVRDGGRMPDAAPVVEQRE
jgi:hypothetical protein